MAETHFDALNIASASTFGAGVTVAGTLTATGGVAAGFAIAGTAVTIGTQVWTFGTAAPGGGGYHGNICWNMSPTAAGPVGWVCTTPGTWKAWGTIAA